jgi:glycosyltransferase involved in cell wall biosynthesis
MFSLHIDTARTWRGGQNQCLLTVMGLRSLGHRTGLVAHPEGELYRRAAEGPDLIPIATRNEMDLTAGWRLARVLRSEQPRIIHAHDPHGVAMASLAISFNVNAPAPLVIASRRVDFPLKTHAFSRWKYRQVDLFICASEAIRQIVLRHGVEPERVVTVHEGIDVGHVDAAPRADLHAQLWLPHRAPVVGNIGALVGHKGQRHLIDAAALVMREVPDARFVIAGEGELRGQLEAQVHHLGLEKHVLLTGFRPDVLSLLKGFDVFVMSSTTEGLGTSILDAMACHRPVAGTAVGGIPEVVADGVTGLLVPPANPAAMAAAIVKLLKDAGLRQKMGEAGRKRVEREFTVERMVRGTLAAYEALGGRAHAGDTSRPPALD